MTDPRGWRRTRVVSSVDSLGRPVTVTTGLTTNTAGEVVAAIGIDNGPTAILDSLDVAVNIEQTLADLRQVAQRGER
ncbi:hypothetical protein [Amycolatopsis sp. H20-H5]|uniref:hypothetical protein n=1 Tax=Amycolatopsis sp. H20-H5 TaxID=3046309 RepID=UPI002DBA4351|nr:hypothetical protein [Amycolatopsis sp. H20-H5]MEC3974723.1 hypothetical protein [Amycolatopsis sp. H20-H5]